MPDAPTPFHANPRTAPDDVWDRVREDYLSGLPAAVVCRRHGVGMTAMRNRALREGWRRADQAWTPPQTLDPDDEGLQLEHSVDGDLNQIELSQLTHVAHCRMMRAVMRGQASEALRWRRVRQALEAEAAIEAQLIEQEERLWEYLHGPAAALPDGDGDTGDVDSVDSVDPVFLSGHQGPVRPRSDPRWPDPAPARLDEGKGPEGHQPHRRQPQQP